MRKIISLIVVSTLLSACGGGENSKLLDGAPAQESDSKTDVPTDTQQGSSTDVPVSSPVEEATQLPTIEPTIEPTHVPTNVPASEPTVEPTVKATNVPTHTPTNEPTVEPTIEPTAEPTSSPTTEPSSSPTTEPTSEPTSTPSAAPIAAVCGNSIIEDGEFCDDGNLFDGDYCSATCDADGPLAGTNIDGRFGEPDPSNTLTLDHFYYSDIQASFSEVDWQTLERLYIPAGEYTTIWLENLPNRSPDNPLVITNKDGQVRLVSHPSSKFNLSGGANWVLTGRYDPISKTGHEDFTGHQNNQYENSRGHYGIYIDYGHLGSSGITVRGGATDFELEFIEIYRPGFAGILVKNDNDQHAHMRNVKIHDMYIHDAEAECLYIGNTSRVTEDYLNQNGDLVRGQHKFENLWVYNNRCIRTGAESLQLTHVGDGTRVFNNVFMVAAMDWKDAFTAFQEGNAQIGIRDGDILIENNIFIGSVDSMLSLRPMGNGRETFSNEKGLTIRNNYFSHSKGTRLSYVHVDSMKYNYDAKLHLDGNFFGKIVTQKQELISSVKPDAYYFQTKFNKTNPLIFTNNVYEDDSRDGYFGVEGVNGERLNLTAEGNTYGAVPVPEFVNSGFAKDFDYKTIEVWGDCNVTGRFNPNNNRNQEHPNLVRSITYELNDYVTHHGVMYQYIKEIPEAPYCDHPMWMPCRDSDPDNYPITLDVPYTYSVGDIVDTHDHRFYELKTPHEPYVCTRERRFKNIQPADDDAWEEITLDYNIHPNEERAAEYWRKVALPADDVRLTSESELQGMGLLDRKQE